MIYLAENLANYSLPIGLGGPLTALSRPLRSTARLEPNRSRNFDLNDYVFNVQCPFYFDMSNYHASYFSFSNFYPHRFDPDNEFGLSGSTVIGVYINTMKTTLWVKFWFLTNFFQIIRSQVYKRVPVNWHLFFVSMFLCNLLF